MKENNKMKTFVKFLLVALVAMFGFSVMADTAPTFPDPTTIYSGLATPFNAALLWVIGAIGVLTVIGWILRAVRRR